MALTQLHPVTNYDQTLFDFISDKRAEGFPRSQAPAWECILKLIMTECHRIFSSKIYMLHS
jgi:hypothetical protein